MTLTGEIISAAEKSFQPGYCDRQVMEKFIRSRRADSGGLRGRGLAGDLYYTQFGLMILSAAGFDPSRFCDPGFFQLPAQAAGMDLVDLASFARCLRLTGMADDVSLTGPLAEAIERYQCPDGGYNSEPGTERGTIYATFAATCGIEDLGLEIDSSGFASSLGRFRQPDGGRSGNEFVPIALTPVTAAATVLAAHFGFPDEGAARWLVDSFRREGGVGVSRKSPAADLLSTAVALHALGRHGLNPHVETIGATEKYVLSLRGDDGGFRACRDDSDSDIEYTFYGMLAMGEISCLKKRAR